MKEYKFRGKASISIEELNEFGIKNENGWVYGYLVKDDNGYPFIVGNVVEATDEYVNLEYWVPVIPETVGMFTGETDKNGKEIYEGHIVEFNDCSYQRTGGRLDDNILIGKIVFAYGMWGISTKKGFYELREAMINDEELEIIGNIYENPELMEKGR